MFQRLPQGQRVDHELLRAVRRLPAQPSVSQPFPAGRWPTETLLLPQLHQGLQAGTVGPATGRGGAESAYVIERFVLFNHIHLKLQLCFDKQNFDSCQRFCY